MLVLTCASLSLLHPGCTTHKESPPLRLMPLTMPPHMVHHLLPRLCCFCTLCSHVYLPALWHSSHAAQVLPWVIGTCRTRTCMPCMPAHVLLGFPCSWL